MMAGPKRRLILEGCGEGGLQGMVENYGLHFGDGLGSGRRRNRSGGQGKLVGMG
jgi:hypothetical protein